MKTCLKCNLEKDEKKDFYYTAKRGIHPRCKKCVSEYAREYCKKDRMQNIEKYLKRRKRAYWAGKEKNKEKRKAYNIKNRVKKAEYDKKYRIKNLIRIAQVRKAYYLKVKNMPIFKIESNLRSRVHRAIKYNTKSAHTFELIGCDAKFFKSYIESLWLEGMSWDNYGKYGWHIDHIIPCCSFDLSKPEEQKKCFHYTNQRPLWAKDNLSRPKSTYKR